MRIRDWEDWRFHWPSRYRDVFRQPQDYFVGEELALDDPGMIRSAEARVVWLEPPADMGRPVWRDVLEQTQLGPEERAAFLAARGSGPAKIASTLGSDRRQGSRAANLAIGRSARDLSRPTWRSSPTTAAGPA